MSLFDSSENLFRALNKDHYLVGANLERMVKPNVALLQECGPNSRDIFKLCIQMPRMLHTHLEHFQAMMACSEGLGVPCGSGMFRQAL